MALNYIWVGFILMAFVVSLCRFLFAHDIDVFNQLIYSTFDSAKTGFELSLGLTGVLSLWLGLLKIAEQSGLITSFARFAAPVFGKLFPGLPKDHPAAGSIFMNISANMLGLDNAATPIGLRAMQQLQALNDRKGVATNAMIMFLNINASGLTIIPVTIMVYRAQFGAANPSDVFLPILLATFFSTLVAVVAVCVVQKINLFQKSLIFFFGGLLFFMGSLMWLFSTLPSEKVSLYSSLVANSFLFLIICGFLVSGIRKKLNVYDTFVLGAKEGFLTAVKIIPYLIAILVAIGVFRASGALDYIILGIRWIVACCGIDTAFVESLPTVFMKPLSGSGARGMMIDAMKTYGADSFTGRLSCVVQGSTDTIFYVVAVYYGSIGVRNTRHTIPCALIADLGGAIAAIIIAYIFFPVT
jgi:spore maturation protein SpmA